jgi:hypothetical protein
MNTSDLMNLHEDDLVPDTEISDPSVTKPFPQSLVFNALSSEKKIKEKAK